MPSYELLRHIYSVYLYNSSHKLSSYIQRVVLHHVESHSAHYQHMLLVMQVHAAAGYKGKRRAIKWKGCHVSLKCEEQHLVGKSSTAHFVLSPY